MEEYCYDYCFMIYSKFRELFHLLGTQLDLFKKQFNRYFELYYHQLNFV